MLSPTQRAETIRQIRQAPGEVAGLLAGMSPERLDQPCRPGEWTVRQVVHHMADAAINQVIRMKLVLTEDEPTLQPFDQDDWVELADVCQGAPQLSLAILQGTMERIALLLAAQPEDSWSRAGIHLEAGRQTLEQLAVHCAGHAQAHLEQLRAARQG
ncbi:MAG: DinB family protein [Anaerolineaceae bacterium]|nr:DinB family protein [Anaerolineaceae bacterium]